MHLANYPALPPPANTQARDALAPFSSPPIPFASPLNIDLLERARVEYKLRKFYHSLQLITDAELLHARLRWTALLSEYAADKYPPTAQTTVDMMYRLCGLVEDETLRMHHLRGLPKKENLGDMPAFAAMQASLAALRGNLASLAQALGEMELSLKKEKRYVP